MVRVRTIRKHRVALTPLALMVVFLFCFQGIAASCTSLLPETKFHAPLIKKQAAASKSMTKKPGKQVALLRGSVYVACCSATYPLENLQQGSISTATRAAIPARAPPEPIARQIYK